MSPTWRSEEVPVQSPVQVVGWARVLLRGSALLGVLVLGVLVTLLLRFIEAPVHGRTRPWTGWITVAVCRIALRLFGLRVDTEGTPMQEAGIFVANHSSWLDIFVLNAGAPLFFVSKSEVASWPGIGWLARVTGTIFVRRARQDAEAQRALLEDRIGAGQRLLFFPEGTSTDGQRVLPFKPTLFAALFSDTLKETHVQPVTVVYSAPDGQDPRFFGWWGDMAFGPHLLQVLACGSGGRVRVTWHAPLVVRDHENRKVLAREAERLVRSGHPLTEKASVETGQ